MENSPLAKLPPEIRNMIHEMVVLDEEPIDIECLENYLVFPIPGLLHTCSQLRAEASSIYYGGNIFVVSNPAFSYVNETELILHDWLRMLGPKNRGLVRDVRLYSDYYPVHPDRVPSRLARIRQRLAGMVELEIDKARIWVWSYTGEYDGLWACG